VRWKVHPVVLARSYAEAMVLFNELRPRVKCGWGYQTCKMRMLAGASTPLKPWSKCSMEKLGGAF